MREVPAATATRTGAQAPSLTTGGAEVNGDRTVALAIIYLTHLSYRLNGNHDIDVNMQQSCGAAIRVKPKARLCEPWVLVS